MVSSLNFIKTNKKHIMQIICTICFFAVIYTLLYELFSGAYEDEDEGLGYKKPHQIYATLTGFAIAYLCYCFCDNADISGCCHWFRKQIFPPHYLKLQEKAEAIKKLPERYRITICPISYEVMEEPVSVNGTNYNKKSIIKFGNRNDWTCPKGESFTIKDVLSVPDSL